MRSARRRGRRGRWPQGIHWEATAPCLLLLLFFARAQPFRIGTALLTPSHSQTLGAEANAGSRGRYVRRDRPPNPKGLGLSDYNYSHQKDCLYDRASPPIRGIIRLSCRPSYDRASSPIRGIIRLSYDDVVVVVCC